MDGSPQFEISVLKGMIQIDAEDWDRCANPAGAARPIDPFTTHRFLSALEESGSVSAAAGWQPRHLVAKHEGEVVAAMPLYAKGHSQGEFIFDHNWAHAYENAGGSYYPKLQTAAPFTPATGRRFLTRDGWHDTGVPVLMEGAVRLAAQNGLSSWHVTFCTEDEYQAGGKLGLLQRQTQQFHWVNQSYANFDDFLATLSSRKRKTIRRERRIAQDFGGQIIELTGDDLRPEHWDAFWMFYQDTGNRKWGRPYLTRQFFDLAQETLRDDILLVLALRDGQPIAGALNFIGAETLYGRYWGCIEDHSCLHFELCYYRAIDYAIRHGLKRVEAGAQGDHKLARGYLPMPTYSLHWLADPNFSSAVKKYLEAERQAVDEEIEVLTDYGPFRKCEDQE
ncbi:GNAT family N-acetyltransferase [Halovulum sp. GXIMD14793]